MLSLDELTSLAVTIGGPLVVVAAIIAWRSSRSSGRGAGDHTVRVLAVTLLVMGIVVVGLATLYPAHGLGGRWFDADINRELFDTVGRYRSSTRLSPWIVRDNLLGNVALFVPFGAGVALAARRWGTILSVLTAIVVGGLLSATVESLQWVLPLNRSVDVDDVLLNTIGAAVGGVLGALSLAVTGLRRRGRQVPEGYERTI